ncbi:glycosyltransferase WbuB [Arthrobacter livingstonensis]|uniref:D-inositol 3-phosphate glycosyltransferase n=1 Tax=Arthrobacter livingstonensis TaxID=670078 RepID=A0A2V5LFY9_9MICC|nr:glycosyltransferase family 4 protein [Arthrobacter livingstonensis]PYI68803.1 glycosyltransferase WbuB [Arthrobacter livingstonensis]
MGIGKNLLLAVTTASQHLSDDPVVLALQLSRRLPARLVQPVAKTIVKLGPSSAFIPSMIAACVSGDEAALDRRFKASSGVVGESARILADVALAAGRTHEADRLISAAGGARKLPATVARRKWHDGDMTGAINALLSQSGPMRRQRDRLEGERLVYSESTIRLPKVGYSPVENRVLHLLTNSLPHTGSGYAQRSHSMLQAQQAAGMHVLAATRLGYPVQVGKIMARDEDVVEGVTYRRMIPVALAATSDARLQQEAEQLLDIAYEFRPAVLHTTTHFVNGLVVGAVAKALDIPWVYEVRGQLADTWASSRDADAKQSERYLQFLDREAQVMLDADLVVTLGESMRDGIVNLGVPAVKVMLAPNAVGGAYLAEPKSSETARLELKLDPNANFIGTVSSIVDYEGLADLVTAFSLLAPTHPALRLLIVGDGTALPALKIRAKELGVGDKIVFPGRVPRDQASLYHQAIDIFVVPRKDLEVTRSVTPLKPVEALASGRPVVASDLPALREIIQDHVNGRLFPAGDMAKLTEVLAEMLASPESTERMGRHGRSNVLATRTWAANATTFAKKYEELSGRTV